MDDFLSYVVIIMFLIVVIGYFNERRTKITYEIALMLFSVVIGAVLLIADAATADVTISTFLRRFDPLILRII